VKSHGKKEVILGYLAKRIKIGTLSAILSEIATTLGIDKNELIEKLR
jgi:hypothetical protein